MLQNAALAGATLTGFDLRVPKFATADLTGETVHEVVSRGKHLLHRIGEFTLHTHLKMEGAWRTYAPGREVAPAGVPGARGADHRRRRERRVRARHHRAAADRRRGAASSATSAPTCSAPTGIPTRPRGASPPIPTCPSTSPRSTSATWPASATCTRTSSASCAACCRRARSARSPTCPAFVDLAERMLQANKDRWVRSTTGDLRPGNTSWVYGRRGRPCRRCGTRLLGGELGRDMQERTVTWCPSCQTLERAQHQRRALAAAAAERRGADRAGARPPAAGGPACR